MVSATFCSKPELPIIVLASELPHFAKGRIGLVVLDITTGCVKSKECSVAHVHFKASKTAKEAFAPRQYSMHLGAEK
jgi:hypothetical protein